MKIPILVSLIVILAANASPPVGEAAFDQGMKEIASKDWDKALDLFENGSDGRPR